MNFNGATMTNRRKPVWNIDMSQDYAHVLAEEVKRQGMEIFSTTGKAGSFRDPAFYVGTIEGMKNCQQSASVYIDWCDWDRLACTSYYTHWGPWLLTQDYGFYPLAEVRRLRNSLWRRYQDQEGYVYFRPNSNDKIFGGGLFKKELLEPWLLQTEKHLLRNDLLCLVGYPTPILAEYRLVVAKGRVAAGSQYLLEDRICYKDVFPASARIVAEQAAAAWSPHPVFVLDVAYTINGDCRIIECGSIHTAGLYEADRAAVVRAIANAID